MKGTYGRGGSRKRRPGILMFARQGGFSLYELLAVIGIIAALMGVTTLAIYAISRKTDISAVAEMIKEDIRKMYALADGAKTSPASGTVKRDQYRIVFHNNSGDAQNNPKNTYQLQKRTWDGSAWGAWTAQTPDPGTYANVVPTNWIKPTMDADCQLSYSYQNITFVSRGSVTNVCPDVNDEVPVYATGAMTITVSSVSQVSSIVITVTDMGNVTSSP